MDGGVVIANPDDIIMMMMIRSTTSTSPVLVLLYVGIDCFDELSCIVDTTRTSQTSLFTHPWGEPCWQFQSLPIIPTMPKYHPFFFRSSTSTTVCYNHYRIGPNHFLGHKRQLNDNWFSFAFAGSSFRMVLCSRPSWRQFVSAIQIFSRSYCCTLLVWWRCPSVCDDVQLWR